MKSSIKMACRQSSSQPCIAAIHSRDLRRRIVLRLYATFSPATAQEGRALRGQDTPKSIVRQTLERAPPLKAAPACELSEGGASLGYNLLSC